MLAYKVVTSLEKHMLRCCGFSVSEVLVRSEVLRRYM